MKFVSAVTALVAAMAVGTEARKPKKVSRRVLKDRMKNGQFNKATIMANAKPHNEAAKKRKLEDNNRQVTGDYSIQFHSCFSLQTTYSDVFEEDDGSSMTMSMFSSGDMLAVDSYAVFSLIAYGVTEQYVVDMPSYVQALINYLPDQMDEYCEACEENYDACQQELYGQNYGNGYNNNYNGNNNGNRKLSDIERVLNGNQEIRQLDCSLCQEYGCLSGDGDNNNDDSNGYESAAEWLEEMSECKETGIQYQGGYQNSNGQYYQQNNDEGLDLYAGMICNGDGTGVEIGMFADEDCKLYLRNEPYSNYMAYSDTTYQAMTKEVLEFTFSSAVLSCADNEVVYTTSSNYNSYNQNQDYNEDDNNEIAEWCEDVVSGETYPVDMKTCGSGNNNNNYGYGMSDDDAISKMSYYEWYNAEIGENDSIDMSMVCSVVKQNGQHTFYNMDNGSVYSYTGVSASISELLDATEYDSRGLSGAAKFSIVALVGIVLGAAVAVYLKFQAAGQNDKSVGLIDPDEVEQKGGEVA
jgi:hypothetical protein